MMINITLRGRIPSKKNNKIRTGKVLISNPRYQQWHKDMVKQLDEQKIGKPGINKPVYIKYKIWFPDRKRYDLSNKIEGINDLLVDYGVLEDDNHFIIQMMNITSMGVDRENPRAEIQIYLFNNME